MLLETHELTKDYGAFRALDRLTLQIDKGAVFGLLGPNGSGKTTALRLLLGFLKPTAGRATVNACDCWHDSVAVRRQVAYLPGELRLYENMTGRQLVQFLARLRGTAVNGRTDALARLFDIDLNRRLVHLSSGMKRKVALLAVLVPDAPLVILDEPTNALDPTMRDELLRQIRAARDRGQTVLFSSHVLTEVEQVCDRVGILQRGRLVHQQSLSELGTSRLVDVRFATPVNEVPELVGLRVRERSLDTLSLEHAGELPPLLDWLGRHPVVDLRIERAGLADVYHRYHRIEA